MTTIRASALSRVIPRGRMRTSIALAGAFCALAGCYDAYAPEPPPPPAPVCLAPGFESFETVEIVLDSSNRQVWMGPLAFPSGVRTLETTAHGFSNAIFVGDCMRERWGEWRGPACGMDGAMIPHGERYLHAQSTWDLPHHLTFELPCEADEVAIRAWRDRSHDFHLSLLDSEGNLLDVLGGSGVLTDDFRSNVFRATAAAYGARIRRMRVEFEEDMVGTVSLDLLEWR
jgi:hypothetical protein